MSYNALDNLEKVKKLLVALMLERSDLVSQMDYESATAYCPDCPYRWNAYERLCTAVECCKESDDYQVDENRHLKLLDSIMSQLNEYIGQP